MYATAVFLPLLGAVVVGLLGRRLGDRASQVITCLLMGASAVLTVPLFNDVALNGNAQTVTLLNFITSGDWRWLGR